MNPISRRFLLASAGAAAGGLALAACTGTPNIPRPTASPTGPLRAQLDEVLKIVSAGSDRFGVSVTDLRSGGTYGFNGDYASQNASMVKVMIALMALRKARYLTEGGTSAFSTEQGAFVYDLMGKVTPDQAWGVGAPGSATVAVHLKNGWVQFKSTDGLWAVNSMGTVKGEGRDYRMAVMTRVPDFPTGRELTSEVGRQVFSVLGTGPL